MRVVPVGLVALAVVDLVVPDLPQNQYPVDLVTVWAVGSVDFVWVVVPAGLVDLVREPANPYPVDLVFRS